MRTIPPGPPPIIVTRRKGSKRDGPCPVPNTHEKIEEAHYFLHMAAEYYHWPEPFKWNLNAFLQALRSTTDYLRREQRNIADDGLTNMHANMSKNPRVSLFIKGRNLVVHERALLSRSRASLGVFDYARQLRVAVTTEVNPQVTSETLLRRARNTPFVKSHLRGRRSDGWQAGVEREWVVGELGDGEVTSLALVAFREVAEVVGDAHRAAEIEWSAPDECEAVLKHRRVMLESELPPYRRRKASPRPSTQE